MFFHPAKVFLMSFAIMFKIGTAHCEETINYLFLWCLSSLFFCLEHTIRAENSTNAIKDGIAQNAILNGNSSLGIHPSK